MDDPALQVECPHCGAVFNVADGAGGRRVTCPVCRGAVTVLDVEEKAPATATAEQEPAQEITAGSYFAQRADEGTDGPQMVCCAHEEKLNPLTLGPLLRTFLGLSTPDAARQVTHGMGILAEGLAADTARAMLQALQGKGVEAFTVPAGSAPESIGQVHILGVHDVDERGLHLQTDAQGTVRGLRWDSVVAGVCTKDPLTRRPRPEVEIDFYYGGGGLYGGGGGMPGMTAHRKKPSPLDMPPLTLSLLLHDGQGGLHAMKVTPQHVRYAYLGDRIREGHDPNFALFLTDIGRHAQAAYFPPSYIRVAGGNPMAVREIVGRVEYYNYLRWAVCCAIAQARGKSREDG